MQKTESLVRELNNQISDRKKRCDFDLTWDWVAPICDYSLESGVNTPFVARYEQSGFSSRSTERTKHVVQRRKSLSRRPSVTPGVYLKQQ